LPAVPLDLEVGVERDRIVEGLVEQVMKLAPVLAKAVPAKG